MDIDIKMEHFRNELSGEEWEWTVFYLTELDCLNDKLEFFRQLEIMSFFNRDQLIHYSNTRGDEVVVRDYFYRKFVPIKFWDYIMADKNKHIAVIPPEQMEIYTNLDNANVDFTYLKL